MLSAMADPPPRNRLPKICDEAQPEQVSCEGMASSASGALRGSIAVRAQSVRGSSPAT